MPIPQGWPTWLMLRAILIIRSFNIAISPLCVWWNYSWSVNPNFFIRLRLGWCVVCSCMQVDKQEVDVALPKLHLPPWPPLPVQPSSPLLKKLNEVSLIQNCNPNPKLEQQEICRGNQSKYQFCRTIKLHLLFIDFNR